uniref:Uncharacterized protein n=1 Tax=Tanacetum cinerariifolium TaxID=118510 RepID=A0A699ID17_TANCI|nr:hypothetical protein [Tanacetum cinerariifolium]
MNAPLSPDHVFDFFAAEPDEDDEWLMALVTPLRATVTVSSTYEVIDDLCIQMSNLEYRHEMLTRKMEAMSDAQVANNIVIREVHPKVASMEGQMRGMTL